LTSNLSTECLSKYHKYFYLQINLRYLVIQNIYKYLLYLNRFRREPAMTKLDKPFTPNNKSSQNIATFTSSA